LSQNGRLPERFSAACFMALSLWRRNVDFFRLPLTGYRASSAPQQSAGRPGRFVSRSGSSAPKLAVICRFPTPHPQWRHKAVQPYWSRLTVGLGGGMTAKIPRRRNDDKIRLDGFPQDFFPASDTAYPSGVAEGIVVGLKPVHQSSGANHVA